MRDFAATLAHLRVKMRRDSRACAAVFCGADLPGDAQLSELQTLLAIERAARAAVEKASVNMCRSNIGTPLPTPSRVGTRLKGNSCGSVLELPSPLLEDGTQDVMAPPRAQVLSYLSPGSR